MMKITDLDFDCLEYVLEYLDLIDLLNVADSTKRLNKAAGLVYAQNYGNKGIQISKLFRNVTNTQPSEIKINKYIICNDLKIVLKMLRCFGHAVTKISFWFKEQDGVSGISEIGRKVITYINNYCAKYLKEMAITHEIISGQPFRSALEYFDRPFEKLIRFSFYDDTITEKDCLKRLFPRLEQLRYTTQKSVSFFNINAVHFPYLKKLEISEHVSNGPCVKSEMVQFLQLNPQLKDLTLNVWKPTSSELNTNSIRNAVDSLQNIEILNLDINPITSIEDSDNLIRMKSVKIFKIDLNSLNEFPECCLPFLFDQLEEFNIGFPKAKFQNSFMVQFFDFIDRHPNIKRITIRNASRNIGWLVTNG